MDLHGMQQIKQWHLGHRTTHPVESSLWELMLMFWVTGWIGLLPVVAFDALWAMPVCIAAAVAPELYVGLRARLHRLHRLRCDWLVALGQSLPRRSRVRR